MSDSFDVICPYCGETIELCLEEDLRGEIVQDCEVCCNPWLIRVIGRGTSRRVDVSRADGSE